MQDPSSSLLAFQGDEAPLLLLTMPVNWSSESNELQFLNDWASYPKCNIVQTEHLLTFISSRIECIFSRTGIIQCLHHVISKSWNKYVTAVQEVTRKSEQLKSLIWLIHLYLQASLMRFPYLYQYVLTFHSSPSWWFTFHLKYFLNFKY